jgi:hypothetical protein
MAPVGINARNPGLGFFVPDSYGGQSYPRTHRRDESMSLLPQTWPRRVTHRFRNARAHTFSNRENGHSVHILRVVRSAGLNSSGFDSR